MSELAAVFPPPPWYYEYFTKTNVARAKEYAKLHKPPASPADKDSIDSFPYRLMVPPVPPKETYRGFGSVWQVHDKLLPLQSVGIRQLYDEKDVEDHNGRIEALRRLLKSLLLNFLQLLGMMSVNPESFPAKTEDIRVILINMHHLLNEYRPHQSRESLILLMNEQIDKKKASIAQLRQALAQIKVSLADMASSIEIDPHAYTVIDQRNTTLADLHHHNSKVQDSDTWRQIEVDIDAHM